MSNQDGVIPINICPKRISFVSLLTITYYRVIGITFGGITADKISGKFNCNLFLKYYGIFIGIGLSAISLLVSYAFLSLPEISVLLQSDMKMIYYFITIWCLLINVQVMLNMTFLNRTGIKLYGIVEKYPMHNKLHLAIFFILWFSHIISSFIVIIIDFLSIIKYHYLLYLLSFIHKLFLVPLMWSVPFLSWAISMGKCKIQIHE